MEAVQNFVSKKPPVGWPRISCGVFYDDAAKAIDFISKAFGFDVQVKVEGPDGRIEHSQLVLGEGLIMVGTAGASAKRPQAAYRQSPRSLGGANTQSICVFVDDVDAHCTRARAAGAKIAMEPTTNDYGADYWTDRTYEAVDPEGHHWYFMQRLRGPKGG